MCMMCGDIRRVVHWSDVEAALGKELPPLAQESWRRRMRAERARLLSQLLAPARIHIADDWASGSYLVRDATGRSALAEDLEAVWDTLQTWGVPLPDPGGVAGGESFGMEGP